MKLRDNWVEARAHGSVNAVNRPLMLGAVEVSVGPIPPPPKGYAVTGLTLNVPGGVAEQFHPNNLEGAVRELAKSGAVRCTLTATAEHHSSPAAVQSVWAVCDADCRGGSCENAGWSAWADAA